MKRDDFAHAIRVVNQLLQTIGVNSNTANSSNHFAFNQSKTDLESIILTGRNRYLNPYGVEDYVGWAVVEPVKNQWRWSIYKRTSNLAKMNGYKYIVFPWVQNLPKWVRTNQNFEFAENARTREKTEALSIFSNSTKRAYHRLYKNLSINLGSKIDVLRIASPYDYGETAYPADAAKRTFPMKNSKPGFWVGESSARKDFSKYAKKKYQSVTLLNKHWGTKFVSFQKLRYPSSPQNKRYWLDFIEWYHTAYTKEMGKLVDIAKIYFPKTQMTISLGWPYEKINLGQDISGLAKLTANKQIGLRTPTGPSVPFIYTKRVATAMRHYHKKPLFSSEPGDGKAKRKEIAMALFKDITTGINWHFDYPKNYVRGADLFKKANKVNPKTGYPNVQYAIFYPTTYHRLVNWNNWKTPGMTGGYPPGLYEYAEELRDILDYDVVDELLVKDGALDRYKVLIWPIGNVIEKPALLKMISWVKNGGKLIVCNKDKIRTVEGRSLTGLLNRKNNSAPLINHGSGFIYSVSSPSQMAQFISKRKNLKSFDPRLPERIDSLRNFDIERDKIFASEFQDSVVLFNSTNKSLKRKMLFDKSQPNLIEMKPLQIKSFRVP